MKYTTYFARTGAIYGVSSKYNFGAWSHLVYKFENLSEAEEWLYTEEYDFRERELMSKSAAIRLAGRNAVTSAEQAERK